MKLGFSQKYAVRPLTAGDVDKILALCAENEQFYRYHPPLATRESVLEDMTALPPGKCAADKHYLGFFDRETLVAVLDLIERYPQDDTAYCGERGSARCALRSTGAIRRVKRSGKRTALR